MNAKILQATKSRSFQENSGSLLFKGYGDPYADHERPLLASMLNPIISVGCCPIRRTVRRILSSEISITQNVFRLSSNIVTGPSLIKETCISVRKRPVST